jgi:methylglutaconyl-CoA hydratase
MWTSPKPIVARLAGPARAGGVGLVAAADFAVSVDTVTFAFTEVRIGVVPAVISVPLRHRVTPHALHRLFLTGERFDAHRAVDIGLLSAVAPDGDLDGEVDRLVTLLMQAGPSAWAGTKQLLRSASASIAEDLNSMQTLSVRYFESDEAKEGMRAAAERRPASWAVGMPSNSRSR